jgi:hypothetical protein
MHLACPSPSSPEIYSARNMYTLLCERDDATEDLLEWLELRRTGRAADALLGLAALSLFAGLARRGARLWLGRGLGAWREHERELRRTSAAMRRRERVPRHRVLARASERRRAARDTSATPGCSGRPYLTILVERRTRSLWTSHIIILGFMCKKFARTVMKDSQRKDGHRIRRGRLRLRGPACNHLTRCSNHQVQAIGLQTLQ